MKISISEKLRLAASQFPSPLYLVGGGVRNALLQVPASDRDVACACSAARAAEIFGELGWTVCSVYPRLGTLKLREPESGEELEYTQFRTERYAAGGGHTPDSVAFTEDLEADAKRRDFRINAIYANAETGEILDPLGGLSDLAERRIRAADDPGRVFGSDGLRLLRLVRFCAELGFTPEEKTFAAALACRDNLDDIAPERIADEMRKICFADGKYPQLTAAQPTPAHGAGLKLLDELGLLRKILPEITAGKGMPQRADFHRFDVFGHTVETFCVSPPEVRIAALLHDVGKPVCYLATGRYHGHEEAGAPLAREIARRAFGCSKKEAAEISELVRLHMTDLKCEMRENKRKRFLVEHAALAEKLLALKQADYLGCGLCSGECPTVTRWRETLAELKRAGTPFSVRELKIDGRDVTVRRPDLEGRQIAEALERLWKECVFDGRLNDRERLLERLDGIKVGLPAQNRSEKKGL